MIGKTIGNYKIIKELGTGGMGTVYLGKNTSIGVKVAIKALHQHLFKNNTIRIRFLKEAKTQAILSHPNITKVIDYIDNDLGLFIILEYIEGLPLNEYIFIKRGLLPEKEANSFMVKILEAVAYAHSKGVIHRDLKSANIMITPDNNIKIMDFGIAKISGESLSLTKTGSRLGSPLYMSPEQVTSGHVDHRSDIYSLGVVYHEMLTGKPVYDQTNTTEYEIYEKIVRQSLPRLNTFYKHTSLHAQNVLDKATSKLPESRFQTCDDFIDAIKNPSSEKVTSKKISTKKSKIGKSILLILLSMILFGGLGYGGFTFYTKYKKDRRKAYTSLRKEADKFFIEHDYKNAYKSYDKIVTKYKNNLKDEKKRISELIKLSHSYEKNEINKLYEHFFQKNNIQINDVKDSLFSVVLIKNNKAIKRGLTAIKKSNKSIEVLSNINSEIEKIEVMISYTKALNYKEANQNILALEELSKIEKIENYPNILKLKDNLFPKNNNENNVTLVKKDSIITKTEEKIVQQDKKTYSIDFVDETPILLNCKKANKKTQIKCIKRRLKELISEKANKVLYKTLDLKNTIIPVKFMFVIDDLGEIKEVQVNAQNNTIETDIENILKSLVVEKPAKYNNKNVGISINENLSLTIKKEKEVIKEKPKPIAIEKPKVEKIKKLKKIEKEAEEEFKEVRIPSYLTIQMADRAPIFPGCEGETGISLIRCTSNNINNYIESNINHKNLKGKGLPTGRISSTISFKINSQGRITKINISCTEKIVKDEIYRVVKSLPQMEPAIYENIQVPINYKLTLAITITKEYE